VDARAAETYREYLESVLPEAEPEWVSFFCYSDRDNWYDAWSGPQYRRADGSAHRPGLLDAGLRRKPAYDAVAAALRRSCS
jgi:GH35 family endo-1,4-beta-xylanase